MKRTLGVICALCFLQGQPRLAAAAVSVSGDANTFTQRAERDGTLGAPLSAVDVHLDLTEALPGLETGYQAMGASNVACGIRMVQRTLVPCSTPTSGACVHHAVDVDVPVWRRNGAAVTVDLTTAAGTSSTFSSLVINGLPTFSRRLESVATPPADFFPPNSPIDPTIPPRAGNVERQGTLDIGQVFSSRKVARFTLPTIPMRVAECTTVCADYDRDGLNDLWENETAEVLKPTLVFDEAEELFENALDHVATLMSIYPAKSDFIVIAYVLAFSRDYGTDPGNLGGHGGDTEQVITVWKRENPNTIRWVRTYAKGHRGFPASTIGTWYDIQAFADGAPAFSVEEDKHGVWPYTQLCGFDSTYDCGEGPMVSAPAFNIGDSFPAAFANTRAVIDDTNADAVLGAFFPNQDLWCTSPDRNCSNEFISEDANRPGDVIGNSVTEARVLRFIPDSLPETAPKVVCPSSARPAVRDLAAAEVLTSIL